MSYEGGCATVFYLGAQAVTSGNEARAGKQSRLPAGGVCPLSTVMVASGQTPPAKPPRVLPWAWCPTSVSHRDAVDRQSTVHTAWRPMRRNSHVGCEGEQRCSAHALRDAIESREGVRAGHGSPKEMSDDPVPDESGRKTQLRRRMEVRNAGSADGRSRWVTPIGRGVHECGWNRRELMVTGVVPASQSLT